MSDEIRVYNNNDWTQEELNIRRYTYKPDLPDQRDYIYSSANKTAKDFMDLRPSMPQVYNQYSLGSCTGNAIGGVVEYLQIKNNMKWRYTPSRLFIYWNEREVEGTTNSDAGAFIRDGVKVAAKFGTLPENYWPYTQKLLYTKPNKSAYIRAEGHLVTGYERVYRSKNDFMVALSEENPIIFGFSVYESFESDSVTATGVVPMPAKTERLLGGHAVMMVGYTQDHVICRNSWSAAWGDKGYFYMPWDYVLNPALSGDFWIITGTN